MTLIEDIKWLSRLPRTRGFGVQSPNDYHFLRHVIRQKMPYYAYKQLEQLTANLTKREVEILHFYLRLANHIQDSAPLYIIGKENYGNISPALREAFLRAGSKKITAKHATRIPSSITSDTRCVLLIEDVRLHKTLISETNLAKIVFDMQDIAVIFCDPKRYKAIYKVNL